MSAEEIRTFILAFVETSSTGRPPGVAALSDDTDLRMAGLIDSLGFVQLLSELERRLGGPVDLADLDPARLTQVGALSRHIAASLGS